MSEPFGAAVYLDGKDVGTTPLTLEISRSSEAIVTVYHDGFPPLTYWVPEVTNGWYLGNLMFGGVIGMLVDIASGHATQHSQTPVIFRLDRGVIERDSEKSPSKREEQAAAPKAESKWDELRWR